MGPAEYDGFFVRHGKDPEGLGERKVRDLQPGQFVGFGIESRDDIAYDHQVGNGMEVLRTIALKDRNGELFKEKTHRGINILIGSRNVITLFFEHTGKSGHPRAANAHKMNMMRIFRGGVEFGCEFCRRDNFLILNIHFK